MQAKQKYRAVEMCDQVQWNAFKDGWPNIFIDDVHSIAGRDGKMCLCSACLSGAVTTHLNTMSSPETRFKISLNHSTLQFLYYSLFFYYLHSELILQCCLFGTK